MTAGGVVINARYLTQPLTGVQRVAREVVSRLKEPAAIIVPPIKFPGPLGHVWEQVVLPSAARGTRLWSPCNSGPIWAKRHAVTIHDAAILEHPEWFSPNFARLYAWLWPRLAKRAKVITVSNFSRQALAARLHIPERDIAVVENGVSEMFAPKPADHIASTLSVLQIPDAPYFVTLSTIEPRKNLELVFKAWRNGGAQIAGARLVVIGAHGAAHIFASHGGNIEQLDGVIFTGRVADEHLPALISGARALIYPSLYEGFGLPVLEGMACGVPVICSRLTSLPEVGGDVATYVDAHDPDDLLSAMLKLLGDADLVRSLGRKGVARAAEFTWSAAAKKMDAILATL